MTIWTPSGEHAPEPEPRPAAGSPTPPGAYEDFVTHVIPELQRRGIYHKDYAGPTLRENLGLPRPPIGHWKR